VRTCDRIRKLVDHSWIGDYTFPGNQVYVDAHFTRHTNAISAPGSFIVVLLIVVGIYCAHSYHSPAEDDWEMASAQGKDQGIRDVDPHASAGTNKPRRRDNYSRPPKYTKALRDRILGQRDS